MYKVFSMCILAGASLAAPTRQPYRRQQDCTFWPDQEQQVSSTFILRIELASLVHNGTAYGVNADSALGYLDAFSTSHVLVAPSIRFASEAFNAPSWSTNQKLIFWDGDQAYERGLNIDQSALQNPEAIAAVISTPGCGTPFVELVHEYADRGECGVAGQRVRAQTGCHSVGSAINDDLQCIEQNFFVCDNTGLQGIADSQKAVFYGAAATAEFGNNCQEVKLVSECVQGRRDKPVRWHSSGYGHGAFLNLLAQNQTSEAQ